MEFRTQIKWAKGTTYSLGQLRQHIRAFEISRRKALSKFYSNVSKDMIGKVVFAVNCGVSAGKSIFMFHLGTTDSSEITGKSVRDSVNDVKVDWGFLEEKIKESKLDYEADRPKIVLDGELLEKMTFWSYVQRREIVAFLVSSAGVPSILSALLSSELSLRLVAPFAGGLISWVLVSYWGFIREGDYALKR
jgi:hypothetical protein